MSLAAVTCQHCEGILLSNKAYRVWTEDSGRILLDMVVCYACNLEAQKLGRVKYYEMYDIIVAEVDYHHHFERKKAPAEA